VLERSIEDLRAEQEEEAAELANAVKSEVRPGRPLKFLALDEHGRIAAEALEQVRVIVRLALRGRGVSEIARELEISPRQVRHVLGADAE
jgi:DNA-binding NarL/FixJ family response regulator